MKEFDFDTVPVEHVHLQPEMRMAFLDEPYGPGADRFRFLRMRLREMRNAAKLKTLLITSPLPGDGKSTIALNLATALAEGGSRRVLLVEADLHSNRTIGRLGLRQRPGLAECLENRLYAPALLRRIEPLGCYFLGAGQTQHNPAELLQSDATARVLDSLRSHFDWIVLDSPPLNPVSDAHLLARHADGILLVARAGITPKHDIQSAVNHFGQKKVLAVLLNGVEAVNRSYSKYDQYYGKKSSSKPQEP